MAMRALVSLFFFLLPGLLYAQEIAGPQAVAPVVADSVAFQPISIPDNLVLALAFPAAACFHSHAYALPGLQFLVDAVGVWGLVEGMGAGGQERRVACIRSGLNIQHIY